MRWVELDVRDYWPEAAPRNARQLVILIQRWTDLNPDATCEFHRFHNCEQVIFRFNVGGLSSLWLQVRKADWDFVYNKTNRSWLQIGF